MKVSDGLWLTNKAALLQLEHFNKSNALSWALTMGLFAMPVIYSDREWSQIVGESYYIQLGPQDRFGWTEPEGKVYQIAADNLERLKDEIYRVCYLMPQAGGSVGLGESIGAQQAVGLQTTEEVLRAYGDMVKDAMRQVLRRHRGGAPGRRCDRSAGTGRVRYRRFQQRAGRCEEPAGVGNSIAHADETVFKNLALKYLSDARQEIKNRVAEEIERGVS